MSKEKIKRSPISPTQVERLLRLQLTEEPGPKKRLRRDATGYLVDFIERLIIEVGKELNQLSYTTLDYRDIARITDKYESFEKLVEEEKRVDAHLASWEADIKRLRSGLTVNKGRDELA